MKTKTKVYGALGAAAVAAGMYAMGRRRWWPSFAGRAVVVIGGTRGLGLVLARKFLRGGALVAICGRDPKALERALADLRQLGEDVIGEPCDARDKEQVRRFLSNVRARFGRVDVLVNNAGVIQVGPLETMTAQDFQDSLDTHLWAPLHAIFEVLPEMRERRDGRIVNVASIGGKLSMPHLLPYNVGKFALVGLSEGLRAELARDRVYVTTVCPWLTRTGSPRNAEFKGNPQAEYRWFMLSDSLPGLSMGAEAAAERILEAARKGEAEAILSLKGKAAAAAKGVLPNATIGLLSWLARLLPGPRRGERRAGRDSEGLATRSFLTGLTRRAERTNNQLGSL